MDRRSESDLTIGEYVDAEAAAMDEWPKEPWPAEAVEVYAGFAQATASAQDLADAKGVADRER